MYSELRSVAALQERKVGLCLVVVGNSKIMVMLSTKKFGYKNTKTTHLGIIYI